MKALCITVLLGIGFIADAAAIPPTGRRRTGTIEHVDSSTRQLTFRANREERPRVFIWNKRTRFVRNVNFVEPSALHAGARADVTYHSPFFGEPFVSRVVLLEPAPARRSRQ